MYGARLNGSLAARRSATRAQKSPARWSGEPSTLCPSLSTTQHATTSGVLARNAASSGVALRLSSNRLSMGNAIGVQWLLRVGTRLLRQHNNLTLLRCRQQPQSLDEVVTVSFVEAVAQD